MIADVTRKNISHHLLFEKLNADATLGKVKAN